MMLYFTNNNEIKSLYLMKNFNSIRIFHSFSSAVPCIYVYLWLIFSYDKASHHIGQIMKILTLEQNIAYDFFYTSTFDRLPLRCNYFTLEIIYMAKQNTYIEKVPQAARNYMINLFCISDMWRLPLDLI